MTTWTADDLPIIGEPVAVEFANSLYGIGPERVDCLATAELIRLWWENVEGLPALPTGLTRRDQARLRELRDATLLLVKETIDHQPFSPDAIAIMNRAASAANAIRRLEPVGADLCIRSTSTARGFDAVMGMLALAGVDLLGSLDAGRLRRCDSPGCSMVFIQQHRRRRWCHPSCGHRVRQANYHRRKMSSKHAPQPIGVP